VTQLPTQMPSQPSCLVVAVVADAVVAVAELLNVP
jgi:hypothetical protein